jgi:hypothetical protein
MRPDELLQLGAVPESCRSCGLRDRVPKRRTPATQQRAALRPCRSGPPGASSALRAAGRRPWLQCPTADEHLTASRRCPGQAQLRRGGLPGASLAVHAVAARGSSAMRRTLCSSCVVSSGASLRHSCHCGTRPIRLDLQGSRNNGRSLHGSRCVAALRRRTHCGLSRQSFAPAGRQWGGQLRSANSHSLRWPPHCRPGSLFTTAAQRPRIVGVAIFAACRTPRPRPAKTVWGWPAE